MVNVIRKVAVQVGIRCIVRNRVMTKIPIHRGCVMYDYEPDIIWEQFITNMNIDRV